MKKIFYTCLTLLFSSAAMAGAAGDLASGGRLYKKQKYGQALRAFQQALRRQPGNQEALFNIGAAHYRLKEYQSAQSAWRAATKQNGKFTQDAQFNLGNAFYRADDMDGAIAAYRQAGLLNPQDKEAVHNLQLALEKKQQQSDSKNQQNQNPQNDSQNKGQSGQGEQNEQGPAQQDPQQPQPRPDQMKQEEADRVTQMAKENEYRRPMQATSAGGATVEKDW